MTNTVEEIAYYCREVNTFGALLLTGEWGSGKTYLLEHDLADALRDSCALIRISLFGLNTVDAVSRKIRKAYFDRLVELLADPAGALLLEPANAWIREEIPDSVERIFQADPCEYIRLESTLCGRTVVLIFDDLERCHLSQAEALGCINEYCENLHLKTIIVANEEKIRDWQKNKTKNREEGEKDFLAYSEIKEKIIARTVKLTADYEAIVGNIIRHYRSELPGYVPFLEYSRSAVVSLLEDCEIRNIRSLRCGLQDFEKVYDICVREALPAEEIRKYFTSFVLFEILAKGGRIAKSDAYGYSLNRLEQKYPGHYAERYLPVPMKDWVTTGAWDEREARAAVRKTRELQQRTVKPCNLIRSMHLLEMDDDLVSEGWHPFLELAYAGELELEEYVLLIQNLIAARGFGFAWPEMPDAGRLEAGLDQAIRRLCESDGVQPKLQERLDEVSLKQCTEEEMRIYSKIIRFISSKAYLYGVNRNRILRALLDRDEKELTQCRSYETNRFDREMALAAAAWYEKMDSNRMRMTFIDNLQQIILNCRTDHDPAAAAAGREALACLEEEIRSLRRTEAERPLKAVTTDHFLSRLEVCRREGFR